MIEDIAGPLVTNINHDHKFRNDWHSTIVTLLPVTSVHAFAKSARSLGSQTHLREPETCKRLLDMTDSKERAHPNTKLNANSLSELQTMNVAKSPLFGRARIEYNFGALIDRTIRERRREERLLAERRSTKHRFQARNSCVLDGRNYRIARRLLSLVKAQF